MTAIATHKRWLLSALNWDGDGERETLETLRWKHPMKASMCPAFYNQFSWVVEHQPPSPSNLSFHLFSFTEQEFLRNTFLEFLGHVAQLKVIPCFSVSCPPLKVSQLIIQKKPADLEFAYPRWGCKAIYLSRAACCGPFYIFMGLSLNGWLVWVDL